ncbi:hypothetical protein [Endozoicomonas sp. GU-1]|uniref:hypothetical protein n=1 Tax=Endozoicomonas sp. GU-1 TaxID=3009078 RepID=UPI0022B532BC|nr:hypothetical protein [Endozoicomonas sp. GU-1]WBA79740.1 hypothetical protein O2T12_15360 [Endozoicomonas sp. GU-1]WBA87325.1 hypothetical protein O3276_04630 [Endozoicomonas sp. GU-1]
MNQYLEAYCRKMESLPEESRISYKNMQAIKLWQKCWLTAKSTQEITGDMLIDLLDERLEKVTPAINHL